MQKNAKQILTDKRGFTLVQWCALFVALCMIMVFIMTFLITVSTIAYCESMAKHALDQYVDENSIWIYQEVKGNSDKTEEIITEEFIATLADACNLQEQNGVWESIMDNGGTRYAIRKIQVNFEEDYTAKLVLNLTVSAPVRFGGISVVWVDVPLTIISRFNAKFDSAE